MGLAASLQHQGAGLTPGLAQGVKGSAVGHHCGSDMIPAPKCHRVGGKEEKKRKEKETQQSGRPKSISINNYIKGIAFL